MKILKYGILFLSIIIWSCSQNSESDSLGEDLQDPGILKLTADQIDKAGIKTGALPTVSIMVDIECTGTIDVPPNQRSIIHTMISANVIDIRVLPGTVVRKGEVIAILEHPNLIDLQLQFMNAASELEKLEVDFKRKKELFDADVTSAKEYQQVKAEYDIATANYQSLLRKLELVGISQESIEKNGIISRIPLRATIDGKIGEIMVNSGEYVEMNEPVFTIINETHKHLELEVFAKDAIHVEKGQKIMFKTPGNEEWFEGEVELINPEVSVTNTVRIHGHILGSENFKIGSFVEARIIINEHDVSGINNTELIRQGDDVYLFRRGNDGFEKTFVKTGLSDNNYTEILTEAQDTNWVINGNYYLNGM